MTAAHILGFYDIAAADPGRLAVVDSGDTTVTYGELLARVNRLSHGLTEIGMKVGDAIAAVMPNGTDFLLLQLAASQLGVVLVPVNWHLTAAEIGYLLRDSGVMAVVTAQEYAGAVAAASDGAALPAERRFAVPDAIGFRPLAEISAGRPVTLPGNRAFAHSMLYTSGTTGRPKGVRRAVLEAEPEVVLPRIADALTSVFDLVPGDGTHLVTSPQYHSAPGAHALYALHIGHTVVISPKFDALTVLELIQRHRVTNTFMVPTMFHRMLALPDEVRTSFDTSSLRQVIHAAAACPIADKRRMIGWLGPVLIEYYGSTESSIVVVVPSQEWLTHPGTVGRPVLGIDIKILDDAGDPLPPGRPGMIYASVASGFEYHNDPEKTARSKRGEYYTPGDIGFLDEDGYLYLCDRRSDLIISGGVNIYPAEVEAALLEHPAVEDVVVFGVPDEEWGHRTTALVQPAAHARPSDELAAELVAHCADRLARFKHPRVLEFRDRLPRTPTGKLSRSKVREEYLAAPAEGPAIPAAGRVNNPLGGVT